jgi:glycosyltransferase involved in cell wall biosynthesis
MTVAHIEWSWSGHHPTYFVNHAAAMARVGLQVVPYCAQPEEFEARLKDLQLEEVVAANILPAERIVGPSPSSFRPARYRGYYDAWKFFGSLGRRLRAREKALGAKIDLVFFGGIYDKQFRHFRFAERAFGFPCAGMYIQGRHFHMPGSPIPYGNGLPCPDKIFTSPLFRGVGVLDPAVVEPLKRLSNGMEVVVFPDVTHEEPIHGDDPAAGLARKVQQFAGGRPIVALVGHLQWTKGLEDFTAAAQHPSLRDTVFLLAGELNWTDVPDETRRNLRTAWERSPNIFTHLQSLSEPSMNAALAACDVIHAAYRSFPNNSNILTKAALLGKPVLVSDGYLMGRLAKEYQLGEVVPEGDREAIVAALRRMLEPDYPDELRQRARWDDYHALHAAERLPECFRELLGLSGGD